MWLIRKFWWPPRQASNIFHDLLFDQAEVRLISGVLYHLCGFCGALTHHERLPIVLDSFCVAIYIFLRRVDGKMRTKMHSQPAQLKSKLLSFH